MSLKSTARNEFRGVFVLDEHEPLKPSSIMLVQGMGCQVAFLGPCLAPVRRPHEKYNLEFGRYDSRLLPPCAFDTRSQSSGIIQYQTEAFFQHIHTSSKAEDGDHSNGRTQALERFAVVYV